MNDQGLLLDGTIKTLPLDIIENILWRLPTEEIVRSSIITKEWRYIWTKLPKVVFTEDKFAKSTDDENQLRVIERRFGKPQSEMKKMSSTCKLFNAIYQFLLLHQGPLVDFTLDMCDMNCIYFSEIDQILLHLSRKDTVKKLHLSFSSQSESELPSSIFSFHLLTDLYLSNCRFNKSPTFKAFGSLTTLCLEEIATISKEAFMNILSNNPLLKSFTLRTIYGDISRSNDEYGTMDTRFQSIPLIENLTLNVWDNEYFGKGVIPRELATSLIHLKYCCLVDICFSDNKWFRFLVLMMRSSPNLEKLTPKMCLCEDDWMDNQEDLYSLTMQDCSDIWLKHLIEFEIGYHLNMKHELEFVKLILAKSPVLEKVRLTVEYKDEEMKWLAVLPFPRASPMVEISIHAVEEEC